MLAELLVKLSWVGAGGAVTVALIVFALRGINGIWEHS